MIRNMEEELGQPLLSRAGRRFTLTDSGRVLFNRAQTILAEMQQLEAELADLQSLQFGRLALGIPPMVGHVYADLIRAYRSRYPRVELSIVEYGGRRIEQAVLEGSWISPSPCCRPGRGALSALELDQYPIQVVLPDLPRWRDCPEIRLEALCDEPFLLYTQAFTLSERLEQACRAAGFEPQAAARSSQWDFLTAMVRSGMGSPSARAHLPAAGAGRTGVAAAGARAELAARGDLAERALPLPYRRGLAGALPRAGANRPQG